MLFSEVLRQWLGQILEGVPSEKPMLFYRFVLWDRPEVGYVLTMYFWNLMGMEYLICLFGTVVLSIKHSAYCQYFNVSCAKRFIQWKSTVFLVLNTNQNATICISSVIVIYTLWFRNLFKLWHYHYRSCWHFKWNRQSFSRLPFDVPKYQPYPVQRYSYKAPHSTLLEEEMISKSFDSN